jgi:hypothetical protein
MDAINSRTKDRMVYDTEYGIVVDMEEGMIEDREKRVGIVAGCMTALNSLPSNDFLEIIYSLEETLSYLT